jgi:hypothetical protein
MDQELGSTLATIRNSSLDVLKLKYEISIPSELAPPTTFWKPYTNEKLVIGLRACLAMWAASREKIVPNEFQLTATIALMSGQDSLVDVGTKIDCCWLLNPCSKLPLSGINRNNSVKKSRQFLVPFFVELCSIGRILRLIFIGKDVRVCERDMLSTGDSGSLMDASENIIYMKCTA